MAHGGAGPDRGHRHLAAHSAKDAAGGALAEATTRTHRCTTGAAHWMRWRLAALALRGPRPRARCRAPGRTRRRGVSPRRRRDAAGAGRAARADPAGARCTSRTTSRRSTRWPTGCRTCRRWPASTRASIAAVPAVAELVPLPGARSAGTRCAALRLSRTVVRVHRLGAATGRAGHRRGPRDRRAPRAAVRACARCRDRRSVDSTLGFTALDGLCMGTQARRARPRRGALPLPEPRPLGPGGRGGPLQAVRPARHLRHQQRHARPARQRRAGGRGSPWTTSSIALPGRSALSLRRSAGSTVWSSPPASASTRRRSAAASARPRPGSASSWIRRRTPGRDRRSRDRAAVSRRG